MINFVFFTFRNFKKEGGGTIRMYGVLNALAENGKEVVFISNATDYSKFHPNIKHVFLNIDFPRKAIFQALLAMFPVKWVYFIFKKPLRAVHLSIKNNSTFNSRLFFFEYLDNSIGYVLKKNSKINHYNNDIHGVSTIEFDYQSRSSKSILKKILFKLKLFLAERLDKKVFESATGIIYSSHIMQRFFAKKYNVQNITSYILPNLLANNASQKIVNLKLRQELLSKYHILQDEIIVLFAGGYKPTAGVDDLVDAFRKAKEKYSNLKLILIGEGPYRKKVDSYVENNNLNNSVVFIDRVEYKELLTYQSLADIIVCPDRMNEFSNMILHLKYLDALISNRIIINGAFESVKEINRNEKLSINFDPSDEKDLYNKLIYCIENKEKLSNKYENVREYALTQLTYQSHINTLLK